MQTHSIRRALLFIVVVAAISLVLPGAADATDSAPDNSFDWAELVGGLGLGSAIGGAAGAGATTWSGSRTRKAEDRRRAEDLQREASDRVAQDIKALAGAAARTQRALAAVAYLEPDANGTERRTALDAVREGVATIGFSEPFIIDDDLRSLANEYMTCVTKAINKQDRDEMLATSRDAGTVLNKLMGRAGVRFRHFASQVVPDARVEGSASSP